jgi:NhaA family Na+:H+ antiporter
MSRIKSFLMNDAASGVILLVTALLAMICKNSGLGDAYSAIKYFPLGFASGEHSFIQPFYWWVNDALMVIFFLVVGLEIKREFLVGELNSRKKAILPLVGAFGGMMVPALIYVGLNWGHAHEDALRGWAIPSATDIAFAVGVLCLFGKRLPVSLKAFLLALAVLDDMGAVLIIAFFYTEQLDAQSLLYAGIFVAILVMMVQLKVRHISLYLLIGIGLWIAILSSGVHATIAGVLLGLCIPLNVKNKHGHSLLESLEHTLKPWVNFGIMPLFAFFNAGVALSGVTVDTWLNTVTLGIMLGLFFGKQIGIFGFAYATIKLGFANKPSGATWQQLYGVSMIAGIGFTMSLFIGMLAFPTDDLQTYVKLGVLSGSFLSAVTGYIVLNLALKRTEHS